MMINDNHNNNNNVILKRRKIPSIGPWPYSGYFEYSSVSLWKTVVVTQKAGVTRESLTPFGSTCTKIGTI